MTLPGAILQQQKQYGISTLTLNKEHLVNFSDYLKLLTRRQDRCILDNCFVIKSVFNLPAFFVSCIWVLIILQTMTFLECQLHLRKVFWQTQGHVEATRASQSQHSRIGLGRTLVNKSQPSLYTCSQHCHSVNPHNYNYSYTTVTDMRTSFYPQLRLFNEVSIQSHPHQLFCSLSLWQRSILIITQLGVFPAQDKPASCLHSESPAADHLLFSFQTCLPTHKSLCCWS